MFNFHHTLIDNDAIQIIYPPNFKIVLKLDKLIPQCHFLYYKNKGPCIKLFSKDQSIMSGLCQIIVLFIRLEVRKKAIQYTYYR